MKWVFANILLINLAIFYWSSLQPRDVATPPTLDKPSNSEVVLLAPVARNVLPVASAMIDHKVDPGADQCWRLGPVFDESIIDRLRGAQAVSIKVFDKEIAETGIETGFRVYIPPFESAFVLAAKRRELHEQGVDNFFLRDGPFKNGLSLGYFSEEKNALMAQEALGLRGVEARVGVSKPVISSFWVLSVARGPDFLSSELWLELTMSNPGVKVAAVPCELGSTRL